jgi:HSP20 family protein
MSQQWNPLHDLMLLQDRMNRLFEDATQRRAQSGEPTGDEFERADWTPAADIYETESGYTIALDLPGINRDALQIDENRLMVKGTRVVDASSARRSERPRGKFLRSFSIPGSIDQGKIGAEYKDGVLQVRLPKRAEQKAQKIEVKIS